MIGPRAAEAVLEHNIEICPVDLRLNKIKFFFILGSLSLIFVVTDGSFIRLAEEHCMLACGTLVPSFLLLRHTTKNTSSCAQASSSRFGPTSDFCCYEKGRGALT